MGRYLRTVIVHRVSDSEQRGKSRQYWGRRWRRRQIRSASRLAANDHVKVKIMTSPNADNPLAHGQKALLTMDVW